MTKPKKTIKNEEEEPWTFCPKCYSIKFRFEDSLGTDCCEDCGCTDLRTSTFEEWDKLYRNRYGRPFLEDKGLIKKSPVFLLTEEQLKTKLFKHPSCMEICKELYPSFPGGLGKEDAVLLLFSKLDIDNRLDALRMNLYNRTKK